MTLNPVRCLALPAALAALLGAGCSRDPGALQPWPRNTDPIVFQDGFGPTVGFQAFGGSKLDALSVDSTQSHDGVASLKISVPNPGNPAGGYAGGAFVATSARDFSAYNALTFWAKASRPVSFDVVGLGNDNTGHSKFTANWKSVPMTQSWKKYTLPIPYAARLTAERGLFFFASGPASGAGFDVWMDEVKFEAVTNISNPRPVMAPQTLEASVGASVPISGTKVTYSVDGVDEVVEHDPGYFTYSSSDPSVAQVSGGAIQVLGSGTTTITAKLGAVDVVGAVALSATAPPSAPPPAPTLAAANVISLYGRTYTSHRVDTWSANWDVADVADGRVGSDSVKIYTGLVYAGIEFTTQPIDASAMSAFHMDIWVPKGTTFKVKLVDFGADGVFGGGDDSEQELAYNATSTPALVTGSWVGLEIPMSQFTGLAARAHLAQLIISGDTKTVYVDNVYFHK
jgi:hypothetical protein